VIEDADMPAPRDGICGDAALHLLGLLDERAAEDFLAHADGCAVCREELGALRPAVDVLGGRVPQLAAPRHVKRQVMSVVRADARPSTAPRAVGRWRSSALGGGARREAAQREGAGGEGAQREGARRAGARGRGGLARGGAARGGGARRIVSALVAAALLAGGIAIGASSSSGPAGGAIRTVGAEVRVAGASAVLHETAGHAWLTIAGLPEPRRGHVYEVWFKRYGGSPQPTSSLFSPTSAGAATVAVPRGGAGGGEVMVTQEPSGGSALPTSSPVIVARV
jgi:Anti-sigma-K factor rskA, C-terminal